jgi:hypothetical protein
LTATVCRNKGVTFFRTLRERGVQNKLTNIHTERKQQRAQPKQNAGIGNKRKQKRYKKTSTNEELLSKLVDPEKLRAAT